jgi:hypothetical protein
MKRESTQVYYWEKRRWLSEIDVINGNRFWKARAYDLARAYNSKRGS